MIEPARSPGNAWQDHPRLAQLLGLAPLLAVTDTAAKALGLGLATLGIVLVARLVTALLGRTLGGAARLGSAVLVVAAAVSIVELLTQAYAFALHQALGIFLPLIAVNQLVLEPLTEDSGRWQAALRQGLQTGGWALAALVILGAARELIGGGTVFADMQLLFGAWARDWKISVVAGGGWLLALLPPGAFIGAGLLLALRNAVVARRPPPSLPAPANRRVRTTGTLR